MLAALEILDDGADQLALGVPDAHARAHFLGEAEQVELRAKLAVVALFGFLDVVQIGLEVGRRGKGRAVDALEHGPLLVAAPVSAGHGQQLHGPHQAGGRHMRTAAQVGERAVPIQGHGVADDVLVHDLQLVALALGGEKGLGVGLGHVGARKRLVGGNALLHLRLNGLQIVRGKRTLVGEIIVEAVFDGRADGDLDGREKLFDGLGHDVGGRVADDGQPHGRVGGNQTQLMGILGQRKSEIAGLPVHEAGHGVFQALAGNSTGKDLAASFAGRRLQGLILDCDLHVAFSGGGSPVII